MPPDDGTLEIRVLGEPRIFWRGREHSIKPPLACQALVAVALAPGRSLQRTVLAQQLFGHLPQSSRSNQARLALRKLRRELDARDLTELVEWQDSSLRIVPPTKTDIDEALEDRKPTLEDLSRFGLTVMEGCSTRLADELRRRVKNWLEANLSNVYFSLAEPADLRAFTQNLTTLRTIYPHSALTSSFLCAALRRMHFAEEYTREIERFESDWLDVFGINDRPDIPATVQAILSESDSKSEPISVDAPKEPVVKRTRSAK